MNIHHVHPTFPETGGHKGVRPARWPDGQAGLAAAPEQSFAPFSIFFSSFYSYSSPGSDYVLKISRRAYPLCRSK